MIQESGLANELLFVYNTRSVHLLYKLPVLLCGENVAPELRVYRNHGADKAFSNVSCGFAEFSRATVTTTQTRTSTEMKKECPFAVECNLSVAVRSFSGSWHLWLTRNYQLGVCHVKELTKTSVKSYIPAAVEV